ncbi:polysaccharide pyruvyl transferase family protein [Antarcticimicrobium luteum]|uniref:Polysaccharide pyruvyl transferase domain-containing protein n=1 Tax=Antarcticimicrobium luteum TaxID=2547397 RepID=A0A4R5VDL5_9RHOB|nr:polysaccharide pyruvyl transferase family protein [Antarcticimicrobium luteum]TDK50410.1 hypothetical protein E1832_06245 [Antarcticimicrobium luteum]
MTSIYVYSWKPGSGVNFGDEIGPMVVDAVCRKSSISLKIIPSGQPLKAKIFAVGSVLHEARGSDVIWGVGVNSKHASILPRSSDIRFNAVRGPLTRSVVRDQGFECPEVFGDPGLLFPMLFDKEIRTRRGELERAAHDLGVRMPETIVIPNINDDRFLPYFSEPQLDGSIMFIRPHLDPITVAAYISASSRVISSSLHGLVFADVYGRSTTRMTSQYEAEFKYTDYYEGTGRQTPKSYPDLQRSLDGEETSRLEWDPEPLLKAFPLFDEELIDRLKVDRFEMEPNKTYEVAELERDKSPLVEGWADPENGSAWSVSEWANFEFYVKQTLSQDSFLRLNVGTLSKGTGAFTLLRVVHNGAAVESHRIVRGESGAKIDISLPKPDAGKNYMIRFKIENASRPIDYGIGQDARPLGVWVSNMTLVS